MLHEGVNSLMETMSYWYTCGTVRASISRFTDQSLLSTLTPSPAPLYVSCHPTQSTRPSRPSAPQGSQYPSKTPTQVLALQSLQSANPGPIKPKKIFKKTTKKTYRPSQTQSYTTVQPCTPPEGPPFLPQYPHAYSSSDPKRQTRRQGRAMSLFE